MDNKRNAEKNQIVLEGISKKYDSRWVLEQVDQTFSCGQSYSFVGHNGCGKSTLLRLISGLTVPSSGKVYYGRPLRFAYVPEKFRATVLTGRTYLKRMCEIDGLEKMVSEERTERLAADFFLDHMLDIPMKNLSKGTLQKIGVLQAIIREPDVLLLDEPLSGQDQESQAVFIRKMNELRECGVTIFMSCHEKKIVDALSDQVFTIKESRLQPYLDMSEKNFVLYVVPREENMPSWEGMKRFGAGYRLLTKENQSQQMISSLLAAGWILKGMYDENKQYGEI